MIGIFTLCCCLPVVLGMHGQMSNSSAICFPAHTLPFQTDGWPLLAFMIFKTSFMKLKKKEEKIDLIPGKLCKPGLIWA